MSSLFDYKRMAYTRANGACEVCKRDNTQLHLHEILRGYNDPSNYLILCSGCEYRVNKYRRKLMNALRVNNVRW